ncbi:alpha/beta hydrolase domain-containing protein [Siccirubricoccus phaeus]|uniref:alpha/beta hydrolase domain-containing protein n=1 Tax=Siccirubricoccus phaeus TaxID=2595053 RepID=UPI0011F30A0D|nr:alpha/beta hydrolase domain-containing protein [Siccirubricoccus phaeus]
MEFELQDRLPFAGGQEFGAAGAYELLLGRLRYAVDPRDKRNAPIADLHLAPAGADGLVRFAGDLQILKPVDLARGNRRLFFDWGNRGNKRCLQYFNDAVASNAPLAPEHAGNGFLLRRGYSLAWGAWQGDLLAGNGRVLLEVPKLPAVRGLARAEFIGQAGVNTFPLGVYTSTYSPPAVEGGRATLTRRRYPWEPREEVPQGEWCFGRFEAGMGLEVFGRDSIIAPSRTHLHMHAGFQPGWIYELVWEAEAPLVLGLGHAAVRDAVSWLRHAATPANPLHGAVEKAYGFGRSQTGRAIRDFLYHGFNEDTAGRRVFDGLMPHVAGAGRLFAGRFGNLTVPAGQQYEDHDNSADAFPFSYAETTDHLTGRTDAILKRPATDPLVLHSQSATEYWQRRGSLVHTTTDGQDLPQPDNVRIYHWCSSQHAANPRLGRPARGPFANPENVVATSMLFRALLDALDAWATHGTPPPESRMPRRGDGTAVSFEAWRARFPAIPGVALPQSPSRFELFDYGMDNGVMTVLPPRLADAQGYAVLLPATDADGNDLGGVRAPMVQAPLATYTAWNPRSRGHGAGALHEYTGSTIAFPDTEAERLATGDPRPSVQSRYGSAEGYVAAITEAAKALVAARLMLEEDVPRCAAAAAQWGAPRHEVGV